VREGLTRLDHRTALSPAFSCCLHDVEPQLSAAREACTNCIVCDGDTPVSIAQAAYGRFDDQIVFNANREQIGGSNPLAVGLELQLPCKDGQGAKQF
jgi:hypothetical protein